MEGPKENLLLAYLAGQATEAERKLIESWIDAHDEHRRLFRRLERTTKPGKRSPYLARATKSFEAFTQRHEIEPESAAFQGQRFRFTGLLLWGKVLILAFILLVGFLMFKPRIDQILDQKEPVKLTAQTKAGEVRDLTLSDGSTVILRDKSTLEYPFRFLPDERKVDFLGSGSFEIADAGTPFILKMGSGLVKTQKASFWIKAKSQSLQLEIGVRQGNVQFQSGPGKEWQKIEARQVLSYQPDSEPVLVRLDSSYSFQN